MAKTHSRPADPKGPGFTVMGYPASAVKANGAHRQKRATALSRGYNSKEAAENFAEVARKQGAEVTEIVEWGNAG